MSHTSTLLRTNANEHSESSCYGKPCDIPITWNQILRKRPMFELYSSQRLK
jgi:hypothetical protein